MDKIKLVVPRSDFSGHPDITKGKTLVLPGIQAGRNIIINHMVVRYELSMDKTSRISQNIGLPFGDWILLHTFLYCSVSFWRERLNGV